MQINLQDDELGEERKAEFIDFSDARPCLSRYLLGNLFSGDQAHLR